MWFFFFAAQRLLGKFKKCSVCVTASQVKDPHLHNFSLYFFTFLVSFSSPGDSLTVSLSGIFRDCVTFEYSKECVTLKHETWLCDQSSALMDKSFAYINTYLPPVPIGWRRNLRYVFAFFYRSFRRPNSFRLSTFLGKNESATEKKKKSSSMSNLGENRVSQI